MRRTGYQPLPDWIQSQSAMADLPMAQGGRRDYLEKTFRSIRRKMSAEQSAGKGKESFLTHLNGPVKIVCFLILLLGVAFSHSLLLLGLFQMGIILLALYSGISLSTYMFRVWIPVILFSGLALLPSIFNFITPGEMLLSLHQGFWPAWLGGGAVHIGITLQGAKGMLFVLLRSAGSLGLATLLLRTTSWTIITGSLAKLRVPDFMIMILDITYRSIYLFLPVVEDYLLGRKSRMVGRESYRESLRWIGSAIADLLRITNVHGDELFEALRSRGFIGEYKSQLSWCWGRNESVVTSISLGILFLLYWVNR